MRGSVLYGYRVGEVELPEVGPVDITARLKAYREVDLSRRTPVQVSLGPHVNGFAMPHPDPNDPFTTLVGSAKRFCTRMPDIDKGLYNEFRAFVENKVKELFVPLPPDSDTTIETWLEGTTYPTWRKEQLRTAFDSAGGREAILESRDRHGRREHLKLKCFMKDEVYPSFKHARAINSRSDAFKVLVGPIMKLIDNELFSRPEFIKKIPVSMRPEKMMQDLYIIGESVMPTDYTAFEATFVKELMAVSNWFQKYMTSCLPDGEWWSTIVAEAEQGVNVCRFRDFVIEIEAKRMSGEMDTSQSNGFMNWMFVLFWAHKTNNRVVTEIEGDDGIPLFVPISNSTKTAPPTTEQFAKLGANIKIEKASTLEEASFCGQVFDIDDRLNVTDPREVLATFGYATRKYANSRAAVKKTLLRCKALSLAYQYPGCPIISSIAKYGMRVTRSHDVRHMVSKWQNTYERDQLLEALQHPIVDTPVGFNTRCLVEKLFHIPISVQLDIESYFDNKNDFNCIDCVSVKMVLPKVWSDYFDLYASSDATDSPMQFWNHGPLPPNPFG